MVLFAVLITDTRKAMFEVAVVEKFMVHDPIPGIDLTEGTFHLRCGA